MNLIEYEGLEKFWDKNNEPPEKKEPKILFPDVERTSDDYIQEPDIYTCWRGSQIPRWMQ